MMRPSTETDDRRLRERIADARLILPELRRLADEEQLRPDWRARLRALVTRLEDALGRDTG